MPTLNWIGKDKVINHHQDVPYKILEHQYHYENGTQTNSSPLGRSGGAIIHGDNLEALKALLPEYEGKIKCIYIDPPYNTGKESWVYNDNVNDPKIKKWLGQVVGKEGEDLSRDDKWLCMMYPRLKLLYKLLADDGVFFCSIDDYEHSNLKVILDEIFGARNFINNIVWQRAYSPINTKKRFSPNHDFILCYAKEISNVEFSLDRTEEADSRYSNPDDDIRGVWTSGDLSVGLIVEKQIYPIQTPSGRIVYPPKGYCWRVTEEKFNEMVKDNRIWFGEKGENVPRFKRFKTEVKDGITPMTVWTYKEVGHTQDAKKEIKEIFPESSSPFDTPKSIKLMERIVQLGSEKNSIILDSFAGSGTTAHAVLNLNKQDGGNRKFILVEMEDYADNITAERVKRVIDGYGSTGSATAEGTGGCFSFYELGQAIFDENHNLNEGLPTEKIRQYVWYQETKSVLTPSPSESSGGEAYLLGTKNGTAYYFHYEKDHLTALDETFLRTLKTKATQYVIYADVCLLDEKLMDKYHIIFKKIPRDISKL